MIKGVLFDKDGTLIELNNLWAESTLVLVDSLVENYLPNKINSNIIKQNILFQLGYIEGNIRPDSILASETNNEIADIVSDSLNLDKKHIMTFIDNFYFQFLKSNLNVISPIFDIKSLFDCLHDQGIKVGIATSDNYLNTGLILNYLEIENKIDFLATGDRYDKKPNKQAIAEFSRMFNLNLLEIVHVGDSVVDIQFGNHGLGGIGVLSGSSSQAVLEKHTQVVLQNASHMTNLDTIEQMLLEKK